uniref:NPHP4 Ig-like domain-containing protein n=1 Tax=Romanomermis culicivorax TaxID=13658 RepID=A0A915IX08_ROMCU
MVDVELNQVLQMWHVHLDVSRPTISKIFKVDIPISSRSSQDKDYISKKIPYTNKYDIPRLYNVSVNCQKLVKIGDPILYLEPRATGSINLLFSCATLSKSFATEVLVFVSNQDGTLEDTFSLQTTSQ